MRNAIEITDKRRKKQLEYNKEHGITPRTITKAVKDGIEAYRQAKEIVQDVTGETPEEYDILEVISQLESEMEEAARNLQFEKAIVYRDQIGRLKKLLHKESDK
jgi:excinuclease ABC subunit B